MLYYIGGEINMKYENLKKHTQKELKQNIDKSAVKEMKEFNKERSAYELGFDVEVGVDGDLNYIDLNLNVEDEEGIVDGMQILTVEDYPEDVEDELEELITKIGENMTK